MIEFTAKLYSDDMVMLKDEDGTARALVDIDFFWGADLAIRLRQGEEIHLTAQEA